MIKQREINQIEENKSSDVIRILDKSIENSNPINPNKKRIMFIFVFLGLFLSVTSAFLNNIMIRLSSHSNQGIHSLFVKMSKIFNL